MNISCHSPHITAESPRSSFILHQREKISHCRDLQWLIQKLGYKDSNLEMTESESVALPFGDSPSVTTRCIIPEHILKCKCFFRMFYRIFSRRTSEGESGAAAASPYIAPFGKNTVYWKRSSITRCVFFSDRGSTPSSTTFTMGVKPILPLTAAATSAAIF
jgi:hypothetical protein